MNYQDRNVRRAVQDARDGIYEHGLERVDAIRRISKRSDYAQTK
jgi:hypothetical protein